MAKTNLIDPQSIIVPSGRQVRAIRAWIGVDQKQFAKMLGISSTTLQRFETSSNEQRETTGELIGLWLSQNGVQFDKAGNLILAQ